MKAGQALAAIARWPLFAKLLLLIGIVWMVLLLWTYLTPKYFYQRTGDELFDRLAILMLDEYHRTRPRDDLFARLLLMVGHDVNKDLDTSFDFSPVIDWREDYDDDPRYWELVYEVGFIDDVLDRHYELSDDTGEPEPIENTKPMLFLELASAGDVGWSNLTGHAISQALQYDEDVVLAAVDDAIASNPDNSYFYYLKADILMLFGEAELAQEQVRLGNATPDNFLPQCFPARENRRFHDSFTTRDSRLACGLIEFEFVSNNLPNFIRTKDRYKEVIVCGLLGYPVDIFDDYLVRAKRMAQMDNAGAIYSTVGGVMAYMLLMDFHDQLWDYTPEQESEFKKIFAESQRFDQEIQQLANYIPLSPKAQAAFSGPLGWADPWEVYSEEDWHAIYPNMKKEWDAREQLIGLFDILDPPPFAVWARGDLLGLDVSGVKTGVDLSELNSAEGETDTGPPSG